VEEVDVPVHPQGRPVLVEERRGRLRQAEVGQVAGGELENEGRQVQPLPIRLRSQLLFWLWIARWGGARRLEGTFASGFLVHLLAPRWTSEGLQLFAWLSIAASTFWFILGIFVPWARPFV